MKRGAIVAGLAAMWFMVGCGTDVELGLRPQFSNGTSVLTVLVYDGISGAQLEGVTMQMRIGPNVLEAQAQGNAYTFTNVPAGSQFPIFAKLANYLEFVGNTAAALPFGGTLANPTYTTATLALYPTNSVDEDIVVKVFDEMGAPVSAGKVIATIDQTTLATVFNQALTGALVGDYGMKPSTIVVDLTAGTVTIPRAQLVFGATYQIKIVGAKNAAGTYLAPPAAWKTVDPTAAYAKIQYFMGPPAVTPIALTANNEEQTFATPYNSTALTGGTRNAENGLLESLVVVFPYVVKICNEVADWGITFNRAEGDDPADSSPLPTGADKNPFSATLSADGMTLTLTPNINSATPRDPQDDLEAVFSGLKIRVDGTVSDATCVALSSVTLRNSATTITTRIDMQDRANTP